MSCLLIVILALFGGVGLLMPVTNASMSVVDVIPTLAPTPTGAPAQLGVFVAGQTIDADGCPTDATSSFTDVAEFYVGLQASDISRGTTLYTRLVRDGQPLEDSPLLTADRDYTDTCVYFQFTHDSGAFEAGEYEAILFVDQVESARIALSIE
jgi:hypothetical protein